METKNKGENNKNSDNKNMLVAMISITGLLAVLLIVLMIFLVPAVKKDKAIKQADSLVAMGKFEDGVMIYERILSDGYSTKLMLKRDAAIELMESEEYYEKGIAAADEGDIVQAIKYLSKVPITDNKTYKKAEEELVDIEETAAVEVQELIDKGELSQAKEMVNTYLKISPDSGKMKRKMDNIHAKHAETEKHVIAAEQELKNQEAEALVKEQQFEVSQKKTNETRNTANSIIGTYKSIVSGEANLRDAPTLNSSIIAVLPQGTNVYIHDTQIESADRIWCLVDTGDYYWGSGWVSYNTINYKIK